MSAFTVLLTRNLPSPMEFCAGLFRSATPTSSARRYPWNPAWLGSYASVLDGHGSQQGRLEGPLVKVADFGVLHPGGRGTAFLASASSICDVSNHWTERSHWPDPGKRLNCASWNERVERASFCNHYFSEENHVLWSKLLKAKNGPVLWQWRLDGNLEKRRGKTCDGSITCAWKGVWPQAS